MQRLRQEAGPDGAEEGPRSLDHGEETGGTRPGRPGETGCSGPGTVDHGETGRPGSHDAAAYEGALIRTA